MYFAKNTHSKIFQKNPDDSNENPKIKKLLLIKFGGNAMQSKEIQENVIEGIISLKDNGFNVVIVHGGGPAINEILKIAGIESEFCAGHRITGSDAITYVEMALKGRVNGELVSLINANGRKAVGLSGKDGQFVRALKRFHYNEKGEKEKIDLGFVGDVDQIDPELIITLLYKGYIPVIAPIAFGEDNNTYNINADMFAGHLATALKADNFVALTDVDGLRRDKDDPSTLINYISLDDLKNEFENIVAGGMIPKTEACIIAVENGVKKALIINGMTKNILKSVFIENKSYGTIIEKWDYTP